LFLKEGKAITYSSFLQKKAKELIKKFATEKKEREKRLMAQRRLNAERVAVDI
jgi:hypothetical protein